AESAREGVTCALPRPCVSCCCREEDGGCLESGEQQQQQELIKENRQTAANLRTQQDRKGRTHSHTHAGSMSRSSDSEDGCFVAMDTEDAGATSAEGHAGDQTAAAETETTGNSNCAKHPGKSCQRAMGELPEEVLEYILSFLSPYQEHKTAALVCKQWYRLIKGVAYQCYHGFLRAVQEGNIQWESRTYPYPGTPITQRFSHSACYYDSNQSMYVFGGCTQSSCNAAFNDLWRLDLNSKEWIRPLASALKGASALHTPGYHVSFPR
ncbi:hypothetical protein PGIGA_G00116660, partial [Pangasianodon gigas]|nr:hypothetical protein [Pangasianodon gigas]